MAVNLLLLSAKLECVSNLTVQLLLQLAPWLNGCAPCFLQAFKLKFAVAAAIGLCIQVWKILHIVGGGRNFSYRDLPEASFRVPENDQG